MKFSSLTILVAALLISGCATTRDDQYTRRSPSSEDQTITLSLSGVVISSFDPVASAREDSDLRQNLVLSIGNQHMSFAETIANADKYSADENHELRGALNNLPVPKNQKIRNEYTAVITALGSASTKASLRTNK